MAEPVRNKIRSFVAFALPPELHKPLQHLQWEARDEKVEARWVKPEQIHCTLKFLGECAPKGLDKVRVILERLCRQGQPLELAVRGCGVFPDPARPRVLWVGVDDPPALRSLQQAIDRETAALGFKSEEKDFHPHLTLGRMEGGKGSPALAAFLQNNAGRSFGRLELREIGLVKSELTPQGPIYTSLARFRLG